MYKILQPFMMTLPGVNPAVVAGTVDLAGKDEDEASNDQGGVGGVSRVGDMPEGNHSGHECKSGKASRTGLFMVEAMNKLAERKEGTRVRSHGKMEYPESPIRYGVVLSHLHEYAMKGTSHQSGIQGAGGQHTLAEPMHLV